MFKARKSLLVGESMFLAVPRFDLMSSMKYDRDSAFVTLPNIAISAPRGNTIISLDVEAAIDIFQCLLMSGFTNFKWQVVK